MRRPGVDVARKFRRKIKQQFKGLGAHRYQHIESRIPQKTGVDKIGFCQADGRQIGSQLRIVPNRDSHSVFRDKGRSRLTPGGSELFASPFRGWTDLPVRLRMPSAVFLWFAASGLAQQENKIVARNQERASFHNL